MKMLDIYSAEDPVWNLVRNLIWNSVEDPVWSSVEDSQSRIRLGIQFGLQFGINKGEDL